MRNCLPNEWGHLATVFNRLLAKCLPVVIHKKRQYSTDWVLMLEHVPQHIQITIEMLPASAKALASA
jgi:hypothetical protein